MLREGLKCIRPMSSCSLSRHKMVAKSMDFSRAPRFSGKQSLGRLLPHQYCPGHLQGPARPANVLVPNDVAVIPTYVELRRHICEAKLIPGQWRGNAERGASRAQVWMSHDHQQKSQSQ